MAPASAAAAAAAARMARDGGSRNEAGNARIKADGKDKEPAQPGSTIDAGACPICCSQHADLYKAGCRLRGNAQLEGFCFRHGTVWECKMLSLVNLMMPDEPLCVSMHSCNGSWGGAARVYGV